jgi:hypothetical protein
VNAIQLSEALTFWTAPHPAWKPNSAWPQDVGFATWLAPDCFVLIDPLVRDDLDAAAWQPFDRAVSVSGRSAAVLLTAPWHERSAGAVVARYGAGVWIHPHGRDRERALVVAEFFLGDHGGLRVVRSPATEGTAAFAASLNQLRQMAIDRVLVAHGPPVLVGGGEAVAAALDAFAFENAR